jgi:hypothetical protein
MLSRALAGLDLDNHARGFKIERNVYSEGYYLVTIDRRIDLPPPWTNRPHHDSVQLVIEVSHGIAEEAISRCARIMLLCEAAIEADDEEQREDGTSKVDVNEKGF